MQNDLISREDAEMCVTMEIKPEDTIETVIGRVHKRLKDLPPVTPQASEEDIHREREQAYMLGYEDASKRFRTESCEDAISRQQALDCFEQTNTRQGAKYAIETLPSVTPQRPKGKWIEVFVETPNDPYSYGFKSHKCSKCEHSPLQISNYCPNCGAKMEEE